MRKKLHANRQLPNRKKSRLAASKAPKTPKKAKKACCDSCRSTRVQAKLLLNEAKRIKYDGADTLVVPVVMARASVVMNEILLPLEEMFPEAWNGVPVTIGHPMEGDEFISANQTPKTLAEWSVGRIFNVFIDGDKLKGEAWINVGKLEDMVPGLLDAMEADEPIDVSTGLFSDTEEKTGKLNGREYKGIHRNVVPDHLAILVDEEGACNWDDGCGVRANAAQSAVRKLVAQFATNLETALMRLNLNKVLKRPKKAAQNKDTRANERGAEDDPRQIMADLISSEDTPFVPDDMYGMSNLSAETLKKMKEQYLPNEGDEPEANAEDEPEANEEDEPEANEDDEPEANEDDEPEANEDDPEANEEDEAKPARRNSKQQKGHTMKKGQRRTATVNLSQHDKEALAFAKRSYAAHRSELIAEIVANSDITKNEAREMTTRTLEIVAKGLKGNKSADYSGRALARNTDEPSDSAKAMVPQGMVASISAARKAKEAKAA